jgi:hypothetical protein
MNVLSVQQGAPSLSMKVLTGAFTVDPHIREQYNTGYESFKSVMVRNYMNYPLQNSKDNKKGDTQAQIIRSIQVSEMFAPSCTNHCYN